MKILIAILLLIFILACGRSDQNDCHTGMRASFAEFRSQQDQWYTSRGTLPPPEHHKSQLHLGHRKRAIILVHGFISSPEAMSEVAKPLIESGHTVVMPLLTGFASDPQAANASTVEDWESGVNGAIELAKQCHSEVALVGHSLGGAMVTRAVQSGRIQPAKVVLLSPFFKAGTWPATIEKAIPDGIETIDLAGLQKWFGFVDFSQLLPIYKAHPTDREPYIPMHAAERVLELQSDFAPSAVSPGSHSPTIMIVSYDDKVVDPHYAVEYAQKTYSSLKVYSYEDAADVGHSLQRKLENPYFDKMLEGISAFVSN